MLDFQKLFALSLKYWWVYAISICICLFVAGCLFITTPAKYSVDAALMLRQADSNKGNQSEMINMMGGGGTKVAVDEIRVLTSRSLLEPIVDELGLTTTIEVRKGLKWINVYPEHPMEVQLEQPIKQYTRANVIVKDGAYTITHTKGLKQNRLMVQLNPGIEDGTYRVTMMPRIQAVALYQKLIKVDRENRESNIIQISTTSSCPALAIDVINHILDSYNQQTATDKNILAIQTDQFLSNRLDVITAELNQSENELENYKRTHHITDLNEIAETYRRTCEQYDQQIIALDAQLRILDYTAVEVNKKENEQKVFPYIDGVPKTLGVLIEDYNANIAKLNALLRTVEEGHPLVEQEKDLIIRKRHDIQSNIEQNRQNILLKRENILLQKKNYQTRLENIPEQDRVYREMERTKTTKENQYMYLIQCREENAMLMASAAIPAITVDRAQMNPEKVAPKASVLGILALLLGFFLPMFYFLVSQCYTSVNKQ